MTSINFNASATTALRTLQQTNSALETTQNHVATGLKIGEAKDNAAYWAISTTLKSDNKSLATVKDALNLGAATVDTAYQGLNKAKDVLDEIKSKLTAATQDGVDRNVIQSEISALQDQLKSIASSSTFSGENWLSIDSGPASFNATKSIVASFSRDSNNAVSIGTVDVNISTVALFDANGKTGIIDGSSGLVDASGNILTVGGVNAAADPSTAALDFSGTGTGVVAGGAKGASVSLGTLNLAGVTAGDKLQFSLSVDGSSGNVQLATDGLTAGTFAASLQSAVDLAIGAGKATVALDAVTNEVTIKSVSTGTASTITAGATSVVDGDGTVTALGGLLTGSSLPAPAYGASTAASATVGTYALPAGVTIGAGDTYSFNVQYGSTVKTINHTFTGIEAAAFTTGGKPTNAEWATFLQTQIDGAFAGSQFNGSGATYAAGDIVVSQAAGAFTIATLKTGDDQSVGISNIVGNLTGATTAAENRLGLALDSTAVGSTGVVGYGTATAGKINVGTFTNTGVDAGDTISFNLNVNGTIHNVAVTTDGLTGVAGDLAADRSRFQTKVQTALDAAFGANKVVFNAADAGAAGAMTFTTVDKTSAAFIAISGVVGADGDAISSAKAGLTTLAAPATSVGTGSTVASVASLTSGTAFAGPQTIGAEDKITFNVSVNGTSTAITIDNARVKAALGGSNVITNTADYATVLNSAFTAGGVAVTASDDSGSLKLDKTSAAGVGTLAISGVASSAGADTISVEAIDISDTALAAAGVDGTNRKDVLSAYITLVNKAITSVTTAAANLGAVSSRIDIQNSFVDTLIDTIDKGVSNLVDADLSEESTKLQALQTKQQLGIQALSIANSSQQNILRLFQ